MLNPVFSTAHLRNLMPIFYKVAHDVRNALKARISSEGTELDMAGWMSRTTLEMLGQAGLGYSFDDFTHDSSDDYADCLNSFL